MGVLGFRREVEGVRDAVREREVTVRGLLEERKGVTRDIAVGRKLLEIDARLGELEERLMLADGGAGNVQEDEDEESEDEEDESEEEEVSNEARAANTVVRRLGRHAQSYLLVGRMVQGVGEEHPFVVTQQGRITRLRNTLLLDLRTALKQARSAGAGGNGRTLKIVAIYRDLGEAGEAIKTLKGL